MFWNAYIHYNSIKWFSFYFPSFHNISFNTSLILILLTNIRILFEMSRYYWIDILQVHISLLYTFSNTQIDRLQLNCRSLVAKLLHKIFSCFWCDHIFTMIVLIVFQQKFLIFQWVKVHVIFIVTIEIFNFPWIMIMVLLKVMIESDTFNNRVKNVIFIFKVKYFVTVYHNFFILYEGNSLIDILAVVCRFPSSALVLRFLKNSLLLHAVFNWVFCNAHLQILWVSNFNLIRLKIIIN